MPEKAPTTADSPQKPEVTLENITRENAGQFTPQNAEDELLASHIQNGFIDPDNPGSTLSFRIDNKRKFDREYTDFPQIKDSELQPGDVYHAAEPYRSQNEIGSLLDKLENDLETSDAKVDKKLRSPRGAFARRATEFFKENEPIPFGADAPIEEAPEEADSITQRATAMNETLRPRPVLELGKRLGKATINTFRIPELATVEARKLAEKEKQKPFNPRLLKLSKQALKSLKHEAYGMFIQTPGYEKPKKPAAKKSVAKK